MTAKQRKRLVRSRTWWLTVCALVALILIVAGIWKVSRQSPKDADVRETPASAELINKDAEILGKYAGSDSCRDCHKDAFEQWSKSNHGLAERAVSNLDADAFRPETFAHGTQHTDIRSIGGDHRIVALGPDKRYETFLVERVIGNDPLRQFLAKFSGGRYQTLEAAYDPRRHQWFNVYGDEDRQPGEWGHWTGRGMNWNSMCAACHNTRLQKNYDVEADVYHTAMAQATVSCEACHGPLKAHNDWQKQFGGSGTKDPTIVKLTARQTLDNCGYCHSRRGELTGDFKPGDNFFDNARLTIPDASNVYYPDGQVHDEDYEFAAFLGSRMHLRDVKCMDCHNPHSAKTNVSGNGLCMRCHNGTFANAPLINPVTHSWHKVFNYDASGKQIDPQLTTYNPRQIQETGGECMNCHMPQTVYMQRHLRHDHGFTTPDPLLTKELGIPNACNRCHEDKDADWALKNCDNWFGNKMERPSRQRSRIIAAAREGDSKARDGLIQMLGKEEISYWRAVAAGLLQPWSNEPVVKAALQHALSDKDELVREYCVRALTQLVEGNLPDAVESIRQRLDDPVRNVRVSAAWALRATLDSTSNAGSDLLLSLRVNADQPIGQMQAGAYAFARNQSDEAVGHYEKAIAWDPNSAPIRNDYAVVLDSLNRSDAAADQLEVACKLEPRNADYHYRLGLARNELGQTEKTIEELQTAVKLDPNFSRAWYNLGLALNSAGKSDEALSALNRCESLSPNEPMIPYASATILARLGKIDEARQAAQRALKMQPQFEPAQELLKSFPGKEH